MGFKGAPEAVQRGFEELKQKLGKKISLHKISGGHYVYSYATMKDGKKGKTQIKTTYLGRIDEVGSFTPKRSINQQKLEPVAERTPRADSKVDERETIALRNLSMNGRMSMAKLAKRIGMSVTGTRHFVKKLEEKYQIKYFAEVEPLKLGYLRYLALIKFDGKMPLVEDVKRAFENDNHVAFVAMTKGAYDMIIMFYHENASVLNNFIYEWRRSNILSNYVARWYITPLSMAIGVTLPLSEQMADWLITESTSLTANITSTNKLTRIEGLVLKELIIDGSQDFNEIDKRYRLSPGRSNYAFYKLKAKGVIDRVTVTITPLNLRYNSLFITETNDYKNFVDNQDFWRSYIISQDNTLINKNAFVGDMGIPDGILHIRPIFNETSFQETKERLDTLPGTRTDTMIITQIIVGSLCYRNFDPAYTPFYNTLIKHGKIRPQNKTDY